MLELKSRKRLHFIARKIERGIKMKKQFVYLPLFLMVAASVGGAMKASAEDLPVSNDWTVVTNGPKPTTVYKTDKGWCMTNMSNYGEVGYYNEKVQLDGLSFDLYSTGIHNGDTFGFYLSSTKDSSLAWKTPTFSVWKGLYTGQTRSPITTSHDYNGAAVVYVSPDKSANTGFGIATSGVLANTDDSTTAGVHYSFKKYNSEWYSITMYGIAGSEYWGNNANYNATDKSTTVYLPIDSMTNFDESEKVYIHYWGFVSGSNTTSDQTIYFENMKYAVDLTEKKASAKEKVNAVDVTKYEEADKEAVTALKTKALEDIEAAVYLEDIEAALSTFETGLAAYKTIAQKYIDELYANAPTELGKGDATANFVDHYEKGFSFNRLNDEGGSVVAVKGAYGTRAGIRTQYNVKNFEMKINAAKMTKSIALVISISNTPYAYISEADCIVGFDVIRIDDNGNYFVTLTNSGSHNISVSDFGTETWHGDYTGRYVASDTGDITIKFITNEDLGQTIVKINDEQMAVIDEEKLFTRLGESEKAYFSFGTMSSDASMDVFAIHSIKDADEETYLSSTGPLATTKALLEEMEESMKDGMTDALYEAYFLTDDGKATQLNDALTALHTYDAKLYEDRVNAVINKGAEYAATYEKNKAVNAVIDAINAIGTVTENSKAAIENAETLYAALPEEYKASVTNYETLTAARAAYDKLLADKAEQAKIDNVIALIDIIGDVTENSKDDIETAEAAYAALTDAQKARVTNYATLTAARAAYDKIIADNKSVADVIKAIDAIGEVTKESGEAIEKAEALYNALSDELKAKVTNYETLTTARATFDKLNKKGCSGAIASVSLVASVVALGGMIISLKKRKEN